MANDRRPGAVLLHPPLHGLRLLLGQNLLCHRLRNRTYAAGVSLSAKLEIVIPAPPTLIKTHGSCIASVRCRVTDPHSPNQMGCDSFGLDHLSPITPLQRPVIRQLRRAHRLDHDLNERRLPVFSGTDGTLIGGDQVTWLFDAFAVGS
jgi:hypothetical protein